MARISAQVPQDLIDELDGEVDYPDERRSDLIREALRLYVELENPREMLDAGDAVEEPEETAGLNSNS